MRVSGVVVWCVLVVGCAASRYQVTDSVELRYRVSFEEYNFALPNGMTAVLLTDRSTPLVEVDIRYQVGSRDDPPGKEGLAHLVEHLMFTQRVGGRDKPSLGTRLREHAFYTNAITRRDSTHYETLAPQGRFEELLEIEASRLVVGCQTIAQAVFEREREVVRNELRSKPGGVLEGKISAALYPAGHPYAHSPGGTDAALASISLADVCEFVKAHYTVSRAILVVAGNVEPERMKIGLTRYFGPILAGDPAPRPPIPPLDKDPRTSVIEADVDKTFVIGAWPAPPRFSEQATMLDMGLRARLGGAPDYFGGVEAPFVAVSVPVDKPEDVEKTKERLLQGTGTIPVFAVTQDDRRLARMRSRRAIEFLADLETLGARAERYADWRQFGGVATNLGSELKAWDRRDLPTVHAMVLRTFDAGFARWVIVKPRAGAKVVSDVEPTRVSVDVVDELPVEIEDAGRAAALPSEFGMAEQVGSFALANGLEVKLLPIASGLPMVTTLLTFRTGSAHDPENQLGIAGLAGNMLHADAASSNLVTHAIARSVRVGPETTTFAMRGIAVQLEPMLATLGSLMEDGTYPEFAHGRGAYEFLKEPKRMRRIMAERALRGAMYGAGHPYANTGDVMPWTWENIGRFDVVDFKRKHYVGRNGTLIIVGAVDPQRARDLAVKYLSSFAPGSPAPPIPAAKRTWGGSLGMIRDTELVSPILLGWPAGPLADERFPARLVAADILDRRLEVVRTSLGAAYAVSTRLAAGSAGGVYLAEAAVDTPRTAEAIRIMRAQVAALRAGRDLERDFVRAREKVMKELLGTATSTWGLATWLDQFSVAERGVAYRRELVAAVAGLTVADVGKVLAEDLDPDHSVLAVGGSRPFLERLFSEAGVIGTRYIEAK